MKNNRWLELFLFLLAAFPGLIFSYLSIQEPWTLFRLSRLVSSLQQNHIATYVTSAAGYRVEHLGGEFIESALLTVSQWPAEWLGLLPIGSLFFVIIYYALAYKLSQSKWIALLIAIFVGWYYPRLVSQYSIQTYVWTNTLFLCFLIVLLEWIRKRRIGYSILIIILYVATFLFYQTTPIWIIVAIGAASFFIYLLKRKQPLGSQTSWALSAFCVVIYLTFDTVLYQNFLQRITSEATTEELIQNITSKILAPLFQKTEPLLGAYEISPANPRIAIWATLIGLLIMVVPVGYWWFIKITRALKNRDYAIFMQSDDDIFIGSVSLAAIGHALIYITYGAVSIRVIPLAFPLLILMIPRSLRLPRSSTISFVFALSLALTSVAGFLSYIPTVLPDVKPSDLGYSASLIPDHSLVLADAGVFGAYQLNAAVEGKFFDLLWLDSDQYQNLLGDVGAGKLNADIVIVDKYNKPLIAAGWVFLDPWLNHIQRIDDNPALAKIYDSDYVSLYQPREFPLAYIQTFRANGDINPSELLGYTLEIIIAVIFVLLVPGGLLLLLIKNRLPVDIGGPLVFSSLSLVIGMSLAVFAGYVANFSPLGLQSIPWLLAGLSTAILLVLIYLRTEILPLAKLLTREFMFTIVLIIAWSVLMTAGSYMRTIDRGAYVEFFVTQNEITRNPVINVVNRLPQPGSFTVVYAVAGITVETKSFLIQPGQFFHFEIEIPESLLGQAIQLQLNSDSRPNVLNLDFVLQP